jgi:hypothetical protein
MEVGCVVVGEPALERREKGGWAGSLAQPDQFLLESHEEALAVGVALGLL